MTSEDTGSRRSLTNAAFVVEALVLLAFVAGCLAVLLNLFADSYTLGSDSMDRSRAVQLASNAAEEFAADPQQVDAIRQQGDLFVCCDVSSEQRGGGVLYCADIKVYGVCPEAKAVLDEAKQAGKSVEYACEPDYSQAPVYSLQTARYVSGGEAA